MNEKRLVVACFGLLVGVTLAFLAYRFIAPLTVSIFLYYSTRRYHKSLKRLHLPSRARAAVVLASLAVPLVLLIGYALVLLVVEARYFITQYALLDVAAARIPWFEGIGTLPPLTVTGLYNAYQSGQLSPLIQFASEHATFLTSLLSELFLDLFVIVIVTYYLLVDGGRLREWLLRFDDNAIVRDYLEAADAELEAVLFGNLLNVIAIALIAIASFNAYNVVAPAAVEVPYPALAGALTGLASLVPVVGMKLVYLPIAAITAIPVALTGRTALLVYIVGFLAVAVVVVDTIPDIVLRPILSGENTHVGLLMLAYTLGPVVLGFYGLFFAPILLVIGMTFADTALPRLLGADPDDDDRSLSSAQRRLDEF